MPNPPEGYSHEHYNYVHYNQSAKLPQQDDSDRQPVGSLDNYPSSHHAWRMGNHPAVDRIAARQMMDEYPSPNLTSDYDPSTWPNGEPTIVTGNDSQAREISFTPKWAAPSFPYLAQSVHNADQQFPLTTPLERDEYSATAAQLIDARIRQHLAQEAYGRLETVGAGQDPDNPQSQHEVDVSVDAAFDVMTKGASWNRERQSLLEMQAKRAAEASRQAEVAKNSTREKRHREQSSSSDERPPEHLSRRGKNRSPHSR
ncbi:hypothetical protein [Streptomyces sp. IB2014 016-6]|uniref:hypothetical protein n=1 Tax=Streptomyces sp. IB2014 016-6 TaxID=2517818 RepID=UPI0011CAC152|nr:hypothetical protein [Streptomyces sp. IB2014 016-6]TXL83754.1 hypothetical protein EW053_36650 [Streptomyces sp. IB2014 016-6]